MKIHIFYILFLIYSNYANAQSKVYKLDSIQERAFKEVLLQQANLGINYDIVINIQEENGKKSKVLIRNWILAKVLHRDFHLDLDFHIILKKILINQYDSLKYYYRDLNENKTSIDTMKYQEFLKYKPYKIFKKYFDRHGDPRDKKVSNFAEYSAVVAYLVENGALIGETDFGCCYYHVFIAPPRLNIFTRIFRANYPKWIK